jgi:CRP-like cAMP-binding protein
MDALAALQGMSVFRGVPITALRELLSLGYPTEVGVNAHVFLQGDPADSALLLLSGRLIASVVVGGERRQVGEIRPGELVGEQALFTSDGLRSASVIAVEPSHFLLLDADLLSKASANPAIVALEAHMLATLARRIRRTNQALSAEWKEEATESTPATPVVAAPPAPVSFRDRLSRLFGGG